MAKQLLTSFPSQIANQESLQPPRDPQFGATAIATGIGEQVLNRCSHFFGPPRLPRGDHSQGDMISIISGDAKPVSIKPGWIVLM
jgi:hypothetical protein